MVRPAALLRDDIGAAHGPALAFAGPVAHTLQMAGIIRYTRGKIEILNLEGLQDAAATATKLSE